ncbi:MAG: MCE family protein [Actinomycetota bacterium]|nr:MCE family protein [Actinomycetota bacterium]
MRSARGSLIKLSIFGFVAIVITLSVIATLLDLKIGQPSGSYHAMFTNASGLQTGDTVRVAGIEVGKVNKVQLKGYQADVAFTLATSQHMTTTTEAKIAFENLLGQRYLEIDAGKGGGPPMKAGATIPVSRTTPGLDLTAVFTGFQPLLAALNPQQVNQLTGSIIAVFQGQSGAVAHLVQQTAVLTGNLAQSSDIIYKVLDNLSPLLDKVNGSDAQIGQLIDGFDTIVKGLANNKTQLDSSITGASALTANVSNLISGSQPYIDQDLSKLVGATGVLQANEVPINNVLRDLTPFLTALNRTADSGSYLSVYICDLTLNVSGPVSVKLSPTVPQSQPLTLNAGVVGNQVTHFPVCK